MSEYGELDEELPAIGRVLLGAALTGVAAGALIAGALGIGLAVVCRILDGVDE